METTHDFIDYLFKISKDSWKLSKEELESFILCFLLIGFLEKTIQKTLYETILNSQEQKSKFPELVDYLLKERTFTEKINIFEFIINKTGTKEDKKNMEEFFSFCRQINSGIRNNLFHFKINELYYKGKNIIDIETQKKLLNDFNSKLKRTGENIEKTYPDLKTGQTPSVQP